MSSKCERCGREFEAYCAKCREEIHLQKLNGCSSIPSKDSIPLVVYDKQTKTYRFGCSVLGCPCNTRLGWCASQVTKLTEVTLHEYDGDNCIKQVCG